MAASMATNWRLSQNVFSASLALRVSMINPRDHMVSLNVNRINGGTVGCLRARSAKIVTPAEMSKARKYGTNTR